MEVEVEDDDDDDASSAIELGLAEAAGVTNAHERFTDRYVLTQLVRSDCARAFGIPTAAVEVEPERDACQTRKEPKKEPTRERRRRLRDGCSGTKKTNSTRTKAPTRTSPLGRVACSSRRT